MSDLPMIDGMDMWSSLSEDQESPRNLMLHNIDESRYIAALRVGDWKLVKGFLQSRTGKPRFCHIFPNPLIKSKII